MENTFSNRVDLRDINNASEKIKAEIGKYIVGQHQMTDLLLIALLADGHVLIEGVPGVAKTLTAKLLARTIHADFKRIQFTPDLMPSDIIGTSVFNAQSNSFEFRKGPLFANLVLADEINRAPAKTQAALFEAMEERQITSDGTTYPLGYPFMVLATQNPIEQEGTYRLPEAQLDRFLFKIEVTYPDLAQETEILNLYHLKKNTVDLSTINQVLSGSDIRALRDTMANIHVEQNLLRYIAEIVHETRHNTWLFLGASPRASLAILNASKACAALRGRDFISPDDIKYVTPHVLKHRVIITPEKEMEGLTAGDVVKKIIEKVEVPR
ncbi:MAG: MoxR family ATPase [Bacteroidetes bacterium]|jgi:MoxR-like ATPase|nr:MoxR family ATPase [Bacteroidota bacterium]